MTISKVDEKEMADLKNNSIQLEMKNKILKINSSVVS